MANPDLSSRAQRGDLDDAATDVEVIHPERVIQIKGEDITVDEFGFLQGLSAGPLARPLLDDMAICFEEKGDDIAMEEISELFGLHREILIHLMSMVTGKSRDWIMALNDKDGMTLMMTFWQVNSGFFVRRLLTRKLAARQHTQAPQTQEPVTAN